MAEHQKNASGVEALPRHRRIFRSLLFTLWSLFFLSGLVLTTVFLQRHGVHHGLELIRSFIGADLGGMLLILLGLYVVRTIIFIPSSFLGTLTGLLLSSYPFLAFCFALGAASVSAIFSFGIARVLGRSWVATHETERLKRFDEKVRTRGFFTIFILRILFFVPFDLINLASGFSSIRFRDYIWATVLGLIPEVSLQVLVGNSILGFFGNTLWQIKLIFFGLTILLSLYAVGRFLKNHHHFRDLLHSDAVGPKTKKSSLPLASRLDSHIK